MARHAAARIVFSATRVEDSDLTPSSEAVCYTDGSYVETRPGFPAAGAAVVAFGSPRRQSFIRLAGLQSNYKAELLAIVQALHMAVMLTHCSFLLIADLFWTQFTV